MDEQILNLVEEYLQRNIQLHDFQQRFAGIYFQVRRNRRSSAGAVLCNEIVLPLAELSRGHRSEDSFRERLAGAIRPYAMPRISVQAIGVVFGKPSGYALSTNPLIELEGVLTA
jgi:hypothetical protein